MNTAGFAPFLDRLKSSASLVSQAERDGLKLIREGSHFKACCPFHGERTPSLLVEEDHFHCFGCGKRGDILDWMQAKHGLSFWDAAKTLAAEQGVELPERTDADREQQERQAQRSKALDAFVDEAHDRLWDDADALSYLLTRGLTRDTLRSRRIGVAPAHGPGDYGLSAINGRLVFPITRHARVVQMVGRARDPEEKPKYKNLPVEAAGPLVPLDAHRLRSQGQVLLCEGIIDALLLQQEGYEAVATIGTFLKEDWAPYFSAKATYVLLYDCDANGAGQKGAARIADLLLRWGCRPLIGQLPLGEDPASLISSGKADVVKAAVDAAKPWLDHLLESLPGCEGSPYAAEDQLKQQVFPRLALHPLTAQEHYLPILAKRYLLRLPSLRKIWLEWQKGEEEREKGKETPDEGAREVKLIFREDDPIPFNPAQSFVAGRGIYCAYVEAEGSYEPVPVLVTSDRKYLLLQPDVIRSLGLVFRGNKYPSEVFRWSVGTRYKNSVSDWLSGKDEWDPATLYRSLRTLLRRHIWWQEELDANYDLLTLWILGTYVHQLMESFPYIHLRAIKESGKTTLLRVVEALAFNASYSAATTESVVSRLTNSDSATLCIDEAENYRKKGSEEQSAIFEVLRAGYKKGACSRKAGSKKDNFRPEMFDIYSPKILASIAPVDDALSTRCIDVTMLRAGKSEAERLAQFLPEEIDQELRELRGTCYCWGLSDWEEIQRVYRALTPPPAWINRSWEIWKPIVALARYFEPHLGEELESRLLALANALREQKRQREEEQNQESRIIGVLMEVIRDSKGGNSPFRDDWYPTSILAERIKNDLGWKAFTAEALSRFLFDEAHVCTDRKADRRKQTCSLGSRVWHVRLSQRKVWEKAVQLFGYPAEILEELEDGEVDPVVPSPDPFPVESEETSRNGSNSSADTVEYGSAAREGAPTLEFLDPFAESE